MEERQTKITEGAGLTESRLNVDFVDWLRKWSTPILTLVAAVVVIYAGYTWWERKKAERLDTIFADWSAASSSGSASPDTLQRIAEDATGVGAVSMLARIEAADALMSSVRTGLRAGSPLNPDGTPTSAEDVLSEDEKNELLTQAHGLYTRALQDALRTSHRTLVSVNAYYGLAAVAETRGDLAAAKTAYEALSNLVKGGPYDGHTVLIDKRLAALDTLKDVPHLLAAKDLPLLPGELPPAPPLETPQTGGDVGPPPPLTGTTEGVDPAKPDPDQPAPPAPVEPAPTEPAPTEPAPAPTEPAPATPEPSDPGIPK